MLDLLRQDRNYMQKEITKVVQESEEKLSAKVEAIRQNLFDIMSETVRGNGSQASSRMGS